MDEVYPSTQPMLLVSPPDLEWIWAAGLFEGEGCISYNKGDKRRSSPGYCLPRITVNSTDEDVVRRFFRAVEDRGRIRGPISHKKNTDKWKPYWAWEATGKAAVAIMDRFVPWLGDRRQRRWQEVTTFMEANIPRRPLPEYCKHPGCGKAGYARGWCKRHYYAWRRHVARRGLRPVDLRQHQNAHLREAAEREPSAI